MEKIDGVVEAIIYVHPDNGFTVAKLKETGKKEFTAIVGRFPHLQPGDSVSCQGQWRNHPSHGRQFDVQECTIEAPSDLLGIQKYLESGLVKGIGASFAQKIIDRFGMDTLKVIDEAPERLREIPGIGEKKLEGIIECWATQRSVRDVMVFLQTHGLSPGYAHRIYKTYGDQSIEKVKENPYKLAKDVFGIGFKMADTIAQKMGFPLHSPERIAAGIEHVLWELSNDGHTCFPIDDFLPLAISALQVEAPLIEKEIQSLVDRKILAQQERMIWLKLFYSYEQGIAKDLARIAAGQQAIRPIDAEKAAEWVQEQLTIQFATQQKEAVLKALNDKIHIITGGPGTGKSTITNSIITILGKRTNEILLAAPTGRAAKRLTQITRKKAFTIHALLEMDFKSGGFKRNRENPLKCDLLIIDEASMIDTPLLFYLLRAVPSHTRLLFVGDIDQLPSVGAGNVLRDIIQSGLIGVTCLTEIFRQAKGSKIITNAHRINHGEFPEIYTHEKSDFHFIEAENPEAIQQVILELVSKTIPKQWRFDPLNEIQVLSPMKKGGIGSEMLNNALQTILNPTNSAPLYRNGYRFQLNDKVMQIKNNYDKNVYNGDIGRIVEIDKENEIVRISFDEKIVETQFSELDEIVLAYATSVHKFQGSECPCVVMPIHTSHFKLLHRNLLYTAVTRGKRQVYLVGTKKAIAIAIHNNQVQKRYTGLTEAIKKTPPSSHHQQLEFA